MADAFVDRLTAIADAIPGSQFVVADSGHFMAVQHPHRLLDLALPFLLAG